MADGDQLFFFLNGLTNNCRRYVELHHPCKLQDALDYCLNFEQVHTHSQGQIPMELIIYSKDLESHVETHVEHLNHFWMYFVRINCFVSCRNVHSRKLKSNFVNF